MFIRQQLGSPDLSPRSIAAAHGISLRLLHKLFHDQGLTVAGWIRQRRLEHCRHDLANPRFDAHPVGAIAGRWGFTSNAHFSRVFHATYGLSPSDYRHFVRSHHEAAHDTNDFRNPAVTFHGAD